MKPFLLILAFFSLSLSAFAAKDGTYVGIAYGTASSSSDYSYYDGVDGAAIGVSLGFQTSESFAWEFTARQTTFDKLSMTYGALTLESEIEALVIGGGFRWFFLKFFNLNLGLGYSSLKYNLTTTGGSLPTGSSDDSGLGIYYGLGIQIPLGDSFDVFADYTINNFSGDVGSNELTAGLRFRF